MTAIRSICKYFTDKRLAANIALLYGNHREEDILFRDDFEEMQSLNRNLKVVHTISEPTPLWKGYRGRIDSNMIKKEIPDYIERTFYLSGPGGMISAMEKVLLELNVPKKQIKKEIFPGY